MLELGDNRFRDTLDDEVPQARLYSLLCEVRVEFDGLFVCLEGNGSIAVAADNVGFEVGLWCLGCTRSFPVYSFRSASFSTRYECPSSPPVSRLGTFVDAARIVWYNSR